MESRWRKAKMSLGLNLCVYVPQTLEGDDSSSPSSTAALVSPVASSSSSSATTSANTTPTADSAEQSNGKANAGSARALMPTTPTPTSAGLRLSKSGSKSFKVAHCLIASVAW